MIATHHAGIVWHVTITTEPGVRGDQECGDVLIDIDLERAEWDTEWSLSALTPLEELTESGAQLMNLWPLPMPIVGRDVPKALAGFLFGYHKDQIQEGITDAEVCAEVAGYAGEVVE